MFTLKEYIFLIKIALKNLITSEDVEISILNIISIFLSSNDSFILSFKINSRAN